MEFLKTTSGEKAKIAVSLCLSVATFYQTTALFFNLPHLSVPISEKAQLWGGLALFTVSALFLCRFLCDYIGKGTIHRLAKAVAQVGIVLLVALALDNGKYPLSGTKFMLVLISGACVYFFTDLYYAKRDARKKAENAAKA